MKICSPILEYGLGNILFKIATAYADCCYAETMDYATFSKYNV